MPPELYDSRYQCRDSKLCTPIRIVRINIDLAGQDVLPRRQIPLNLGRLGDTDIIVPVSIQEDRPVMLVIDPTASDAQPILFRSLVSEGDGTDDRVELELDPLSRVSTDNIGLVEVQGIGSATYESIALENMTSSH